MVRGVTPKSDRVRLSIIAPDLSHSIWISFVPLSEMTVARVLETVERVLQSAQEWLLGNSLVVEFVHAPLPNGGGYGDKKGVLLRNGRDLEWCKCLLGCPRMGLICVAPGRWCGV